MVYTWPEVATVGLTEAEAKAKGLTVKVGRYPFKNHGKAIAAWAMDVGRQVTEHQRWPVGARRSGIIIPGRWWTMWSVDSRRVLMMRSAEPRPSASLIMMAERG